MLARLLCDCSRCVARQPRSTVCWCAVNSIGVEICPDIPWHIVVDGFLAVLAVSIRIARRDVIIWCVACGRDTSTCGFWTVRRTVAAYTLQIVVVLKIFNTTSRQVCSPLAVP